MLLKSADDKSKRLTLLQDLQKSPLLDARQKEWLRNELRNLQTGLKGEQESAFHLDGLYKDSVNNVLLHDLRLTVEGEVAQIDHLIIKRTGYMVLIETKNYSGDVEVNAHGEFTVRYGRERYGIPSPYEQSRRHGRILGKLLERLEISTRTDKLSEFHHVVLMHPRSVIDRPDPKAFDTSFLLKADQFSSWIDKLVDGTSTAGAFKALFNLRSPETIKEWGEKLKRQHRPADLLALPDFMQPKAAPLKVQPSPTPVPAKPVEPATASDAERLAKKLICAHCHAKISFAEGKFCWNNPKRFGGMQYCREHQGSIAAA